MINVAIADGHRIMREGLKHLLRDAENIAIIGEAASGADALALALSGGLDVLVLDLSIPGCSGFDLIRIVRSHVPRLAILVLTMHEEEQYALRAIRAGAKGYLTKRCAATELIGAIRQIFSGVPYISATVGDQLAMDFTTVADQHPHKQLSGREFEVFSALVSGKKNAEIAAHLQVSAKTVSSQKTRILEKMKMHSVCDLIQYAIAHRLLPPLEL